MSEPPPGEGWWLGPDGQWVRPDPPPPSPPFNQVAVAALVLGILGVTCLPLIGGVLAVVFGHTARRQLRQADVPQRGDGIALAGMVLGYAVIVLAVVVVIGNVILQFV